MTCEALTNPTLPEIIRCSFEMSMGTWAVAAVIIFIVFLYAMYKMRLPFVVQVPIGLIILFVFAGAGDIGSRVGGLEIWTTMVYISIAFVGIASMLMFWLLRK